MTNLTHISKCFSLGLCLLLGVCACTREEMILLDDAAASDKVEIALSLDMPRLETVKSVYRDETPHIETIHVAVFGSSGYLKEYVQAQPIQAATANGSENTYTYTVSLTLNDSHLHAQIIANGPDELPFGDEASVMGTRMTVPGADVGAYWQRIDLPYGIKAKTTVNAETGEEEYVKEGGKYVVDDSLTLPYFQNVPLVRNFAKISLLVDEGVNNFRLTGYCLVNAPAQGTYAVYNTDAAGFIDNYHTYTYEELLSVYPGRLPLTAQMDTHIPEASEFSGTSGGLFVYERPVATDNPTYLIAQGYYKEDGVEDAEPCYYKIDLQDSDGTHFALYRNFKYTITIKSIGRRGSSSPENAASAAGSGDVSFDTDAASLTDISDGSLRLYVDYVDYTCIAQGTYSFNYKFLTDAGDASSVANGAEHVTLSVLEAGAAGAVISGEVTRAASDDADGFRSLSFTTTAPGEALKTQVIRISGTAGGSTLYRDVQIRLMQRPDMSLSCPEEVPVGMYNSVALTLTVPKGLPASMFPLDFSIESSTHGLAPASSENLPVETGTSIVPGVTNGSYHFVRTMDFSEYSRLSETTGGASFSFDIGFVTSRSETPGSRSYIYVTAPYFNDPSPCSYLNYTQQYFTNLAFDTYTATEANTAVNFSFKLDDWVPDNIEVFLSDLVPADGSSQLTADITRPGYYYYTTGAHDGILAQKNVTLNLKTEYGLGYYKVGLEGRRYISEELGNLTLSGLAVSAPSEPSGTISGSELKFGERDLTVSFSYNALAIAPLTVRLEGAEPSASDTRFARQGDGIWLFIPSDSEASQSFSLTSSFKDGVSLSLWSDAYTTQSLSLTRPNGGLYHTIPAGALDVTGAPQRNTGKYDNIYLGIKKGSSTIAGANNIYNSGGTALPNIDASSGLNTYDINLRLWTDPVWEGKLANDTVIYILAGGKTTYTNKRTTLKALLDATASNPLRWNDLPDA